VQVGDLGRLALGHHRRDRRICHVNMSMREGVDQLPVHAIGGAQAKFALLLVEHVDRTGIGAGELHRLGDDGREHGFEVERRVHRLRHFTERAQLADRSAKLVGALAQLIEQPRVLDGNHGLGGEARNQRNLFVGEGADFLAEHAEGTD
jgi:hypothetical protein